MKMKITIVEVRKLLKELKDKYPERDCQIEIIFSSWSQEHLTVYLSNNDINCAKYYYSANEIRLQFNL